LSFLSFSPFLSARALFSWYFFPIRPYLFPPPRGGGIFQYTGCERYWRPFFEPKINLHKIFKNNNRLMKLSEIVYLYLDFTFSRWNRL
jgi:hypothetical protein